MATSPTPFQLDTPKSGALGVLDADGNRIASLSYKGKPISSKVTMEELFYNAQLFIHAPELAAFVRDVAEMSYGAGGQDGYQAMADIIDRARALNLVLS